MSRVPIQEIMDVGAFALCSSLSIIGFSIYPPIWIIPATGFVYWYLFNPTRSDGIRGYVIGPCRYDFYIHKKNKWVRF
jgi:hypothetical protein